mgnify:FL=1
MNLEQAAAENAARERVRQQQRIEDLCAAAIRALTGQRELYFRGQRLHQGEQQLPRFAPHLHPLHGGSEGIHFDAWRGASDGLALRLRYSDSTVHAALAPRDPIERRLFDLLEQLRVEALAPEHLPGMRRNLRQWFEQWSLAYHHSGLNESARGILLYTLAQMCRARVSGEPVLALTEELIDGVRGMLVQRIAPHLYALRQHRRDQTAYAQHALAIAAVVAALMQGRDDERGHDDVPEEDTRRGSFHLLFDGDEESDANASPREEGAGRAIDSARYAYRVYSRAYDRELPASALVRPAQLLEYRERLDRLIAAQSIPITRLTRDLQALLAAPAADGWDGAQEEGRVDGRRLAQLISTPAERRLFRAEHMAPKANCLVSFLIDCSGSMRRYAPAVATLVDVYARALERACVNCEILGFTTGAWNGGRVERDWQRGGRNAHPGRLNEVCHLVFKDAATPWRRARPAIAALLKEDVFRESIDGEAIEWACQRMSARDEQRQFLLVISDGSPMDSATQRVNGEHYLDHHLREVVRCQEQAGRIALMGIGAALDLSPYYRHHMALDFSAPPGTAIFNEVLRLIARGVQRNR